MGFSKGDYIRCVGPTGNGEKPLIKNAIYQVELAYECYVRLKDDPLRGWTESRFIPWSPQEGDYVTHKLNETVSGYVLSLMPKTRMGGNCLCYWEQGSPGGECGADTSNLIPILARAPKQIEEKTELAIGDEVEVIASLDWNGNPQASGTEFIGKRGKITAPWAGIINKDLKGWMTSLTDSRCFGANELRKINGGSGAVAPATDAVPSQGERRLSETSTPATKAERPRTGPYADWAPGDLLAWAARNAGKIGGDAVRDCICRKDWRMAEACMEEWQRRLTAHDNKPTPRIPTYRQITMNEKAFLEPRILG